MNDPDKAKSAEIYKIALVLNGGSPSGALTDLIMSLGFAIAMTVNDGEQDALFESADSGIRRTYELYQPLVASYREFKRGQKERDQTGQDQAEGAEAPGCQDQRVDGQP